MVDNVAAQEQLHRILLSWDYFDLWHRCENGGGVYENLKAVPQTFANVQEYRGVMEPLILEECCAQIMRGVEEGEVMTPHPAVVASYEMRGDFQISRLVLQAGMAESYTDNDLVLICKENPETENVNTSLHALGFCEAHESSQLLRVKFYLPNADQLESSKQAQRAKAMTAGLQTPSSCWWLLRLGNVSTITREWIALQHAHLVPFIDIILSARSRAAPASKHMDIPLGMRTAMERECNPSQMSALQAGLDGTPVVLIQGPPGTGKTRTILNLLSVIMHSAHKGSAALLTGSRSNADASSTGHGVSSLLSSASMETEELWSNMCPWVGGARSAMGSTRNIRDDVIPDDPLLLDASRDCYGLLRRVMPHRVGRNMGPKAHVLVCAPSNSALDEIVMRILRSGLMDKDGANFAPSLVRIGVKTHHSVSSISLDNIVESRLGGGEKGAKGATAARGGGQERDRMRVAVLDEANIVCSTLSFAGSSIFYRLSRKFDVVVIDEAAQAVEPSTLVPLVMGCKQVYLVGDPVQLPATVISTRAVDHGYDCSLFKRLQAAGYPVKILNTQYRMHPEISAFPSDEFYHGELLNGEGVQTETASPWHSQPVFGPFAFYDVAGRESVPPGGASIMNKAEAHMVLVIYRELVHAYPQLRRSASVAVISPYKAQVKLLRDAFKTALGEDAARLVDINTIDGFQGREKDICIFSAVRSPQPSKKGGHKPGIGFVADERRINVALTRARCSLIVIGSVRALQVDVHWANLIHAAATRRCLYRPKPPYADWLAGVVASKIPGPIDLTKEELEILAKVREKVAARDKEGGSSEAEIALTRHGDEAHGEHSELQEPDASLADEGDIGAAVAGKVARSAMPNGGESGVQPAPGSPEAQAGGPRAEKRARRDA